MLESFSKEIIAYCERHTERPEEVLDKIESSTRAHSRAANMLSGNYQGSLLRMLSRLIRPERILEIGTFTGYSAVCMAEGLKEGGKLITIEIDENQKPLIEEHLSWSQHGDKIEVLYGDAKDLLPEINGWFDLVFIDAAKKQYTAYYDLVFDKVRSGGLIVVDNILWRGKVVDAEPDDKTKSIQNFNKKIYEDDRVFPFLMPIRDGVFLVQKK